MSPGPADALGHRQRYPVQWEGVEERVVVVISTLVSDVITTHCYHCSHFTFTAPYVPRTVSVTLHGHSHLFQKTTSCSRDYRYPRFAERKLWHGINDWAPFCSKQHANGHIEPAKSSQQLPEVGPSIIPLLPWYLLPGTMRYLRPWEVKSFAQGEAVNGVRVGTMFACVRDPLNPSPYFIEQICLFCQICVCRWKAAWGVSGVLRVTRTSEVQRPKFLGFFCFFLN